MNLPELLQKKKIIICCGSGGVGKTTVSAALAMMAAMEGRKTLVCTIDPAKRLADSLGLKQLGNTEKKISQEIFTDAGLEMKGELWGMMLDAKRTFDDLIERIAPNEESKERILANSYYQNITTALAGSQEYSAMEKLYDLWSKKEYDLIVLDTPPTKHALVFLDAPSRMTSFLDGSVVQWFVKPYLMAGKMGFKFVHRSAGLLFKILERATGYETMAEIAEFFLAFEGLYKGFKERAQKVRALFGAKATSFVLVTSPQTPALAESGFFLEKLVSENMPLGTVIFNRVYESPTDLNPEEIDRIGEKALVALPKYAPVVDGLIENLKAFCALANANAKAIEEFMQKAQKVENYSKVPFLDHDIHDIMGLYEVGRQLSPPSSNE